MGGYIAAHVGLRHVFFVSAGFLLVVNWYVRRLSSASATTALT
jgi:hypothetical protein